MDSIREETLNHLRLAAVTARFIAERRDAAEEVAITLGKIEGLVLAALAEGDDAEIQASMSIAGEALIGLLPSIWRHSRA